VPGRRREGKNDESATETSFKRDWTKAERVKEMERKGKLTFSFFLQTVLLLSSSILGITLFLNRSSPRRDLSETSLPPHLASIPLDDLNPGSINSPLLPRPSERELLERSIHPRLVRRGGRPETKRRRGRGGGERRTDSGG